MERGEAAGHELYEHQDKERLATANAQRNIVSHLPILFSVPTCVLYCASSAEHCLRQCSGHTRRLMCSPAQAR